MNLGVLAFGDSITNGGGELQWGVALQSWALWLARSLGLPYSGYAIDGCGYVRFVFQMVMPLIQPALGVVGLIVTIRVWNDIVNPVVFLPSRAIKPVSAGLFQFYAETTSELFGSNNA